MVQKSLRNTILINVGAFLLVFILELLSNWRLTDLDIFAHSLTYTIYIMAIIWVNHFVLIPFVLDRKQYFLFGVFLIGLIALGSYIKIGFKNNLGSISKLSFFFLYTTGTGMAAFFLRRSMHIQKKNNEKEKLQKELELNYLKEQVNPHFLFNTLNSIYALSRQQSTETPDVVMQLSELMRYQLESAKKDLVLLKEELEFVENYLLLEEKRLSQRCTIEFLIEGELSNNKIAPMLLIPFVENAIKHGAQATNEDSTIEISAVIKNDQLHFSVVNSKPSMIDESKRKGMGLENVQRRLTLLYPNAHTLEIKNKENEYQVHLMINIKI